MLRASAAAEAAGIPTSTLVCEGFLGLAASTSVGLGMPNIPVAAVPGPHRRAEQGRAAAATSSASRIDDVVQQPDWRSRPRDATEETSPARATSSSSGTFDEVNRYFYEHELSDGLADRAADARERRAVPAAHRSQSRRRARHHAARQPRGDRLEHCGQRRHGGLPARVHAGAGRAGRSDGRSRITASSTAATRPAARR